MVTSEKAEGFCERLPANLSLVAESRSVPDDQSAKMPQRLNSANLRLLDVLRKPLDALSIAHLTNDTAHEDFNGPNVRL